MSRALDAFVAFVLGAMLMLVFGGGEGGFSPACEPHPSVILAAVLALLVGGAVGAAICHRWAAWVR